MLDRCKSDLLSAVLGCERGNIALLFGFAAPIIIGLAGLALDGASMSRQHAWMQNTVDSVSLAVAKELRLYRDRPEELKSVASSRLYAVIQASSFAANEYEADVAVSAADGTVALDLAMVHKTLIPLEV